MGRYYSGDIEGKFWFAVQSSDSANRFGVTGETPGYLSYYFDEEDLAGVNEELNRIEEEIGKENIEKLDNFFCSVNGYNDEIMKNGGVLEIWEKYKVDYADRILGLKIKDCIEKNGSCSFDAEI